MAWSDFGSSQHASDAKRVAAARRRLIYRRVLLAAGIVGICAAGVCYWFWPADPVPEPEPKVAKKRVAKPTPVVRPTPPKLRAVVSAVETNAPDMVLLPDGRRVKKPKTIAEAVALVRLKPGYHRYKNVDEVFSKTNDFQVGDYKAPLFRHAVEGKLGMIATRRRDMVMPPMPPLPPDAAQDFAASLNYVLEVPEGEDPRDTETRMRVETMKQAMKDLMEKEGLTVEQAFHAVEREHNRLANMTQLYKGAYIKMRLSGDEDSAAFLERANQKLREAGACELDENGHAINP